MKNQRSFLIAGLGNPGALYFRNRHNIGFRFLDYLASELGVFFREKSNYLFSVVSQDADKLYLLKPMMYMNLSGIPVLHAASYYKIPIDKIIVVYDDISMPTGKIRIRKKGGAGGHNGVKSIIQNLGKDHFIRIRIGIGQNNRIPLEDYVLSDFSPQEELVMEKSLETARQALEEILKNGPDSAMNHFNGDEA